MPRPRELQISLSDTPYYHCISRCVRRAFLCGEDKQTHQSYEHRRQWVEDKLLFLPQIFAIEVCAYAVMSNHTHLVLHVNEQQALNLNTTEVLTRWHKVFKGTLLTQKYQSLAENERDTLSQSELLTIEQTTVIYRKRLMDIKVTGRCIREDKAGHIDNNLPSILTRLNIEPESWLIMTKQFTTVFHGAVGNEHVLQNFSENLQLKRRPNLSSCRKLLA
ncbi:hypothetical protein RT723_05175 [Psychrosphaera aquimarina]|uniref:Transposase IS200-like domain-containing protein n=1 Tax=Psychrosphaera aquimarina TaxID=2044854 RepID=A0ABU3QZ35_9GAMM|nr:hypothetical protein [Psychrosphaera aquimarina]MDU0112400.1 hypothetical protein [Psychrosphaera aquimarina]